MNVFVFGSNLAGRHGRGAAYEALRTHGAIYGQAEGRQGFSYAIPTKDENLFPLRVDEIKMYVDRFIEYAKANASTIFMVTRIGCGLAGNKDEEIAPLFRDAPQNCVLPENWRWIADHRPKATSS